MLCLRTYLWITVSLLSFGFAAACGSSSGSGEASRAQSDGGTLPDGASNGTASDGAPSDGAPSDGAPSDGARSDASGSACSDDNDCRTFENTCGTCSCKSLGKAEPDPVCSKEPVSCLAPSCTDSVAVCRDNRCLLVPK
jgi:hypothetical protein